MTKYQIDKNSYKEFTSKRCAHKWGLENYHAWIERLQRELPQSQEESDDIVQSYILAEHDGGVSDLLFRYTGSANLKYNRFLYDSSLFNDYSDDEIEQLKKEIDIINTELHKLSTPENIIAYRFTRKDWFAALFPKGKCKREETFICKGFTSTTLFAESLLDYIENHRYNCILKLYLPIGTKGAYIWQRDGLKEYEFLLPPNATFKLIKKDFWSRRFMRLYECVLVGQ